MHPCPPPSRLQEIVTLTTRLEVRTKDLTHIKRTLYKDSVALREQMRKLKKDQSYDPNEILSFLDVTFLRMQDNTDLFDQHVAYRNLERENQRLQQAQVDLKMDHAVEKQNADAKFRALLLAKQHESDGDRSAPPGQYPHPPPPPWDALKAGEVTPPPLQGVQPTPSHCPPGGKCQPLWRL